MRNVNPTADTSGYYDVDLQTHVRILHSSPLHQRVGQKLTRQNLAADLRPNAPPLQVPAHAHIVRKDNRVLLSQGSADPATRGRLAAAFLERLGAQGERPVPPVTAAA